MHRSEFITAVLLAAAVPIAACNYAYSDKDAVDSRATTPAGESAVATSGTLPDVEALDDSTVTSRIQAKFFLDQTASTSTRTAASSHCAATSPATTNARRRSCWRGRPPVSSE